MTNTALDLQNKIILVTGSSRGIGLATAKLLHKRGAKVIIHARSSTSHLDELLNQLDENVRLVLGDLSSINGAENVWTKAISCFGNIDVLVNNAGAWLPSDINSSQAWREGWESNIAINLAAPAELCRLALLHFKERHGGIIINITSRSAHRGDDAEHLAYGAAKGGLLALTKGIARGYGRDNILAYAIAPGWVATDLAEGAIEPSVLENLPLGEVTPASDVAEMVAFLATGLSRHTTGATIDITGADYVR
ncbi:SDR family oxidoreductase [Acinetobacter baumannii]|uniref:SDR family NAD(P)-dependent oxidoreductase n=1 Tax=Acinetobacter calcoaceticus/baumannii complex TaxID=909768 RepID=UPI0018DE4B06|nr:MULTISPECIES: SDR family oxidoreductase [Acinetobacter calcoaceticus/baumannii complex]MDH2546090.1 SDR family NAD(P)-dependent oxidoreductase [Acinetobacter baumannii]MDO7188321.1 SDR family oxidoreductase [Acinetobacter baumannii]MDO7209468.1 SDR family oxidoreductase [Acinetobacter nosocomialis]MDO7231465.1 SDR family oxidoreductase [Acinetobacter nosocomialis]MDO7435669.1 SDR family oxidoreductase [Acinetobacter nosocomialis]